MQIILKDGYVECFSIDGCFDDGIEVEMPEDIDDLIQNYRAYTVCDNVLKKDLEKIAELDREAMIDELRRRRETECFPIVDRGNLWYSCLTETQMNELENWYHAWLDVTNTLVVPETPNWID